MDWLLKLFQQLNLRVVQKTDTFSGIETTELAAPPENPLPETVAWSSIIRPIRQSQSIEDMIAEQNYKGFDRAEFDRIIKALDVQDPEGELLQMLTA